MVLPRHFTRQTIRNMRYRVHCNSTAFFDNHRVGVAHRQNVRRRLLDVWNTSLGCGFQTTRKFVFRRSRLAPLNRHQFLLYWHSYLFGALAQLGESHNARRNMFLCQRLGGLKKEYAGHSTNGALAQLGERLAGSQEVRGSIPLSSTKKCQCDERIMLVAFHFL